MVLVAIKAGYLIAAGGGGLLLWSGLKGKNWSQTLRAVISGKNPQTLATTQAIITSPQAYAYGARQGGTAVGASAGGSATGNAIASDALKYKGAGYVWAGAPGSGAGNWDCSSFANAVIGRDLRLAIPTYGAGTYHGQSHGPNTVVWLVWTGAFTIKKQDMAPGDLAVWQTHMGIITGPDQMISAQDQQQGTQVSSVSGGGPTGELLRVRRLKAVTPGG
jgi:cell wall-associated NlpC family hydrolase